MNICAYYFECVEGKKLCRHLITLKQNICTQYFQAAPTNANNAQNVAPQNTAGWSFSDAFRQARKDFGNRPGGVFEWRGKLYQTNYQNEPYVANPTPVYPGANQ